VPPEADAVLLVKWGDAAVQRIISADEPNKECDGSFMQIIVRDNNVEQALRALKKKLQREGVYREMKLRRHYEKPSEKRARERAAAIRRARKLERKRAEREGVR
jgi:small subunit ribosomal protein S21